MDTYALLADGTTVEIRPATPADFDAVKAMHEAMSPDNAYLRFFSFSPLSAEHEARAGLPGGRGRAAPRCSRWRRARSSGVASYYDAPPTRRDRR